MDPRLRAAMGLALLVALAATVCDARRELSMMKVMPRAVYTQTNDPAGNQIVAIMFDASSGMLVGNMTTRTPTGGMGAAGLGANGQPVTADGLFSQGAVAISGSWLFAVNGGSNTLSLFRISDSDPTTLMLVGTPVDTLGDFPVSVTYSAKCKTACVLNGGKRDGVSCFAVSATGLKPLDASPRPVGLGQSANPPTGPPSTASMIAFNPKGDILAVTIKGNLNDNRLGYIGLYRVSKTGMVSRTQSRAYSIFTSQPVGAGASMIGFLPFGFAWVDDMTLSISDPSVGAVTLCISSRDPMLASIPVYKTDMAGGYAPAVFTLPEAAPCWAAYSDASGCAYIADAATGTLVEIMPKSGGKLRSVFNVTSAFGITLGSTPANTYGLLDTAAAGDLLFSVSPRSGSVVVVDVSGGSMAPRQLLAAGLPVSSMGLAVAC
ncbi:hypothetical protein CHLRE_06g265300v5 [Chlamydomonas reinhardtii]|uniref:3-carboxymuconate cyclase n=1 Tax=Chlamydomonas reinhardtii TaxID=3055 RepID=A0A2K3DMY6_CHLRE|nr:uncharacterized protein CHLRE_06g265300v5 [Chlamydomonas reinhardtii]PNW81899.1 hypothetical protein CHLRE_06g265300v5 [Chlamydomonas reinhardtii]